MREQVQDLREEEVAFLRAELARRRWPGLKAWWRRLSEGEG